MGLLDGAFTRLSSVVGSESTLSEQDSAYLTGECEPVRIEHNEQYGAPISILILGRFGSPKTQFINAARAALGTEPYLTGNTKDVYSKRALVAGFKFKLIDTPGFDDPERSNLEVFEKICTYLLDKKLNTGITGIVYIHYAGDSAESRALKQTMEVLSGILGKSCLPHLTIIVVPVGSGGSGHSASVVASLEKLVDSVFRPIQERVGRSMVSNLEESDITNVLARYATMDPIRLRIQREPPRDLRSFIEASLGYYETDSMKLLLQREKDLAARPYRAKIASLEAALSEQQLFARQYEAAYKQLDNELAGQRYEALAFRQKLQQSRAECSSLRSQLSLQEHIEQSEVIQALKDLNRRIGDIGRSFAACLVDKHIKTMFDKDPGDVTTLDARDLPTLQKLFTHIDGQASLVTSSSGIGMAIEDFLDYSIRYLLCSHLCKRIFSPFHPGVDPSHNKTIALMYDEIQLREPQASSGKWRANCFKSIYRESPDATTQLINKIANDFFGSGFATLIVSFFGDDHNVHFEHNQFNQLKELIQAAWDWNAMLKADVVVLGDFYQSYYQPLSPFEPSWQEEFEPQSGLKADKILCTLALGLISTRAIGGGRPPESTVVCKAMVATETNPNSNNPASAVKPVYRTFKGRWENESKIVVGIDVGTTFSGVAFTFLVKGSEQLLHRVTQWPGQQSAHGKVPSLIWYDLENKPQLFGAEARAPEAEMEARDKHWELAKHFKLHLHPSDLLSKHNLTIEPLPAGVSLNQVYSDFLRYLLEHTRRSFEDRIVDGKKIWEDYQDNMEVVIGHPNGYGIREQSLLRSAAVLAGFSTAEKAKTHVHFVTEAEASVHFCLHYTDLKSRLSQGTNFAVCDAGGSTVDTTLYTIDEVSPKLKLAEKQASSCIQAGAIFVDKFAESYLRRLFENAGLSSDERDDYIIAGIKDFESQTKQNFDGSVKDSLLKIAGYRCNLSNLRVRYGKLVLESATIKSFFDGCVDKILTSVESQVLSASVPYLLLVGGFGENPYLVKRLKSEFEPAGTRVTTTDEAASKAVADGALIWHCANSVFKRAPRLAFGVGVRVPLNIMNVEHSGRTRYRGPSGQLEVLGGWSQIVPKGIPVDSDAVSREHYMREFRKPDPELDNVQVQIYGCSLEKPPNWLTNESGLLHAGFQPVCTVNADLSSMRNALTRLTNPRGAHYWALSYDICIIFGRTELEAYIEWTEEGTMRTGPAKLIPLVEFELGEV